MSEISTVDQREFPIVHEGEVKGYLNPNLVRTQGRTMDQVKKIIQLRCELYDVYALMEKTDDPTELAGLFKVTTQIEYEQQVAWGFPADQTYHNWYAVPKCTCPKLDNADRKGVSINHRIIDPDCPVHHRGFKDDVINLQSYDYIVHPNNSGCYRIGAYAE